MKNVSEASVQGSGAMSDDELAVVLLNYYSDLHSLLYTISQTEGHILP